MNNHKCNITKIYTPKRFIVTTADTVIHYDPWWNPATEDQPSDRAWRIGQNKPDFVYKLITNPIKVLKRKS